MNELQLSQMDMHQRLIHSHQKAQLPPPDMTVDEWADEYRYMDETTKEKWFTERMEVARGPMRAVTEAGVRTITAMCCTQLLKTELILNTIGYFSHNDPCPMLVVQPKDDLAKKFSNVRLKQMINATPVLTDKFKDGNLKDATNTTQHKEFPGGHVTIVSAKVPANLAMFAIRVVLQDEIDKYDESSGKEGDPIDLAEERMSKYSTNSLAIRVCSPTTTGYSRIEASYESSDQRKPFVACPHCQHKQIMTWKNVVWDKNDDGDPILESTAYSCQGCGVLWSEFDRLTALKEIYWLQTADFICTDCNHSNKPKVWSANDDAKHWKEGIAHCEECGVGKCSNSHAGFWANKMYSAFRPISDMVKLWSEVKGNVEKLKTFINTQLAETFEDPGEKIKSVEFLMDRRENYLSQVPDGVGILTAGVDTQGNRLEVEVVGWGLDEESWSIDYKIIPGDPSQPETWAQLDKYLQQPFYYNDGSHTFIAAASVDMGGGNTQDVANYCRRRIGRRIWPIRGVGGDGTVRPIWPPNPGRAGKYDVPFYNIGVDPAKNIVFNRLLLKDPGPGYCHYPHDREEDWFKQLTVEKRVTKWKGARKILVWENPAKARNEAFDVRVYAYASLCGLHTLGWDINELVRTKRLVLLSERNKAKLKEESSLRNSSGAVKSNKKKIAKSKFMDT